MDMMGEMRDMFEDLGCDEKIKNLGEPHISFNPSSERERDERSARDRFRDDYVMTPFSQCTQVWKLRAKDDQRRYAAKFRDRCGGERPNKKIWVEIQMMWLI